ncbi:hypothetical protein B0H17DRAFT_1208978 [Mycena rosella]|uniref:Uncharacterized protein n=1 Tax=Mycena rosella TaxID=1033263 RepID=A0AAD7D0Y9_MYCRO|nr:hypothetical protein B0H17DRAFT_1208978 [Mycena rosella]
MFFVLNAACAAALGASPSHLPSDSIVHISVAALALTRHFRRDYSGFQASPAFLALFPALAPAPTHCQLTAALSPRHAAAFHRLRYLVRPPLAVLWRALPHRPSAHSLAPTQTRASSGYSLLSASPSIFLYPPCPIHLLPSRHQRKYALRQRSIPLPRTPLDVRASFTATSASLFRRRAPSMRTRPTSTHPLPPLAFAGGGIQPFLGAVRVRRAPPTTYPHSVPVFRYRPLTESLSIFS